MRRTILLADDSPTIQRLVKQTFADADFEILSVSNGEAAVRKFEEIRPHVVLADIYMPGKNGYEVCAYVKAHATHAATPVILLVGAFDAFDEAMAKQAGAAANITKPFEPSALVEMVMSVLPPDEEDVEAGVEGLKRVPEPAVIDDSVTEVPAPASPLARPMIEVDEPSEDDLLGLESLFREELPHVPKGADALTNEDIERIVDRVIQKLSSQVIESIAWEIVPDITEKVLREELKKRS